MNKLTLWRLGWKNWLCLLVATVLLLIAYWGGVKELLLRWGKQEEYSHAYMLPLIAAYFIWLKKNEIFITEFSPSWLGFFIAVPTIVIFFIGEISALFILIHYSLVVLIIALTLALMGWPAIRSLLAPLFLLFFAIPIPYFLEANLSANLQLLSSKLGVAFIRLCDITVFLDGNLVDLGIFKLQVVEACSGLRYLYPLMSIGYICAYMFRVALWKRVIIFLSTIPITILMNSFRIGMIGVLVENFGASAAEGFIHDFEGWIIFFACFGVLIIEMLILAKLGEEKRPITELFVFSYHEHLPHGLDVQEHPVSKPLIACLMLLLFAVIGVTLVDTRHDEIPERKNFINFPVNLGNRYGSQANLDSNIVSYLGLTDYIQMDYKSNEDLPINLFIAYYETQRKGVSPHSPKVCIPGGGWQIIHISRSQIGDLPINRLIIKNRNHKQLVYYWFQQRGRLIANEYIMKWYLFSDAVIRNRTDGALVRVMTPIGSTEANSLADQRLINFVKSLLPVLPEYIPE